MPVQHEIFMARALDLARAHLGETSPNPTVGAVLVKNGRIIAEGYHRAAGQPHAEIVALRQAGADARGATLYVTLEPCDHYGRTPPCSLAIIEAGVQQVFYATSDPNPTAGGGAQRMAAAGIQVYRGPGEEEAREINRFFFHHVRTGLPYVIAKFAASLDGKIATHTGDSQWITGPEARQRGHHLRSQVDAILVGAGTVIADDPQLTARRPDGRLASRQPLRVALDSSGRIPLAAQIFSPDLPGRTLVATTTAMAAARRRALKERGVEVATLPADASGRVSIPHLLAHLGQRQTLSLMVEGGGEVLGSFFAAKVVQEVWAFLAPLIIGGEGAPGPVRGPGAVQLADATRLQDVHLEAVGKDWLFRAKVKSADEPSPESQSSPVVYRLSSQ